MPEPLTQENLLEQDLQQECLLGQAANRYGKGLKTSSSVMHPRMLLSRSTAFMVEAPLTVQWQSVTKAEIQPSNYPAVVLTLQMESISLRGFKSLSTANTLVASNLRTGVKSRLW